MCSCFPPYGTIIFHAYIEIRYPHSDYEIIQLQEDIDAVGEFLGIVTNEGVIWGGSSSEG